MLLMGQQLLNKSVMSLRTGGPIGKIVNIVVDPNNLKIEGWLVDDTARRQRSILLSQDVRDIIEQGFVVNDHEALTDPAELVRLQSILDLKFELIGKQVITEDKHRIGKVNDYAFEKNGFFIQKLYINQSVLKSLSGGGAIVDRNQIIEITNKRIIVRNATVPGKVGAVQPAGNQASVTPAQP